MSTYSTVFMVGIERTTIPLQNVVASPGIVEIDTSKIYEDKSENLIFIQTITIHYLEMTILTKCQLVLRVARGLQTIMWDGQGLSTIIERSFIGGGLYC